MRQTPIVTDQHAGTAGGGRNYDVTPCGCPLSRGNRLDLHTNSIAVVTSSNQFWWELATGKAGLRFVCGDVNDGSDEAATSAEKCRLLADSGW